MVGDFCDSFLLVVAEFEDEADAADEEGDHEGAPERVHDRNHAPEGGHRVHVTVTNCGHRYHYAPDCCDVGIEH